MHEKVYSFLYSMSELGAKHVVFLVREQGVVAVSGSLLLVLG